MIVATGISGGIASLVVPRLLKTDTVIGLYHQNRPMFKGMSNLKIENLDITRSAEVKRFVQKWRKNLTRITFIHFAGLKIDGLTAQYEETDWDRVMDVNIKGDFLLVRALLPLMIEQGWGRIIHVSSTEGVRGQPGTPAYAASKSALVGFSNVLANEYGRFNITSNILSLGYFDVGMFHRLSENVKRNVLNRIPSRKLGNPSNITNAIEFLIKSEYVNGAVIPIDGAAG